MTKKDDSGTVKEIVTEQELKVTKYEARSILLIEKLSKEDLFKKLFKKYKDDGTISIKKLIKKLSKKPLKLSFTRSKALARYVVEPREESTIVYNSKRKKEVGDLKQSLNIFLAIPYDLTPEDYATALKSALEAAALKFLRLKENFEGTVDLDEWQRRLKELLPDLEELEEDVLLAIAYEESRDMNCLGIEVGLR